MKKSTNCSSEPREGEGGRRRDDDCRLALLLRLRLRLLGAGWAAPGPSASPPPAPPHRPPPPACVIIRPLSSSSSSSSVPSPPPSNRQDEVEPPFSCSVSSFSAAEYLGSMTYRTQEGQQWSRQSGTSWPLACLRWP